MKQLDLLSSVGEQGETVTQIIHFKHKDKATIKGVLTKTIQQGQFTKFKTVDERLVMVNDDNVNWIEVFKQKREDEI